MTTLSSINSSQISWFNSSPKAISVCAGITLSISICTLVAYKIFHSENNDHEAPNHNGSLLFSKLQRSTFCTLSFDPIMHFTDHDVEHAVNRLNNLRAPLQGKKYAVLPTTFQDVHAKIYKGLCYGTVSVLIENCRKHKISIRDSVLRLKQQSSEILFKQFFQEDIKQMKLFKSIYKKEAIRYYFLMMKFIHFNYLLLDDDFLNFEQKYTSNCIKRNEICQRIQSLPDLCIQSSKNRLASSSCKVFMPLTSYVNVLNKLAKKFPPDATLQGAIRIPEHVFAFEFSPNRFEIFDTFATAGIYSFSNAQDFFNALRALIVEVMENVMVPDSPNTIDDAKFQIQIFSVLLPNS